MSMALKKNCFAIPKFFKTVFHKSLEEGLLREFVKRLDIIGIL